MRCEYCGTKNVTGVTHCTSCGAELKEKPSAETWRSEPLFFNGYMVYLTHHLVSDTMGCFFWLGEKLVERFEVPKEVMRKLVPEGTDLLYFFYDLLLISQGEKEVLRIKEQNDFLPATFEIRRVEHPDKERWYSMNYSEMAEAAKR